MENCWTLPRTQAAVPASCQENQQPLPGALQVLKRHWPERPSGAQATPPSAPPLRHPSKVGRDLLHPGQHWLPRLGGRETSYPAGHLDTKADRRGAQLHIASRGLCSYLFHSGVGWQEGLMNLTHGPLPTNRGPSYPCWPQATLPRSCVFRALSWVTCGTGI